MNLNEISKKIFIFTFSLKVLLYNLAKTTENTNNNKNI